MKQVKKSEVELDKYYMVYYNKRRKEMILGKPISIRETIYEPEQYLSIEWEGLTGFGEIVRSEVIIIVDIIKGNVEHSIVPLDNPFDNEYEDEFFELTYEEVVRHILMETI